MSTDKTKALVLSAESRLREVAPQWLSVERLTRLALAARSRTPALAECTADSFLLFCMRCAETGLEPIGAGGAWPVPYKNKNGTREVQFIPDWRGLINLAKRTDQITHAYADVICENDKYEYAKGDNPRLDHYPAIASRGKPIAAYCICVLPDGSKHIEVMGADEIDAIRKRSKASSNGPWVTDEYEMWKKTVVKRAMKPFAGSPQMQTAIDLDNKAVGLALPEADGFAMPTVNQIESDEGDDADKPRDTQEPHAASDARTEADSVTGIVEDVTEKSGTSKGKDWVMYGVKLDGVFYNTFSGTDADTAKDAKELDAPVTITYKTNAKGYRDIVGIVPAGDGDELPL